MKENSCQIAPRSIQNLFDLIELDGITPPIIQASCPGGFMAGDLLGRFELSAILLCGPLRGIIYTIERGRSREDGDLSGTAEQVRCINLCLDHQ
jgi:hypothetical protein